MSVWDFLLTEYSFIFSVITTIAGLWLTVYGARIESERLKKIGRRMMIVFAVLSVILLIARFEQVSGGDDINQSGQKRMRIYRNLKQK